MIRLKYFVVLHVFVLLFITACSRPGDILLSYSDGNITRKEFYAWLSSNHFTVESVIKSKDQQKKYLYNMGLEKIAVIQAKQTEFFTTDRIQLLLELAEKRMIAQDYFMNVVLPDSSVSENIIFAESLFFRKKSLGKKSTLSGEENAKMAMVDLGKGGNWKDITMQKADNINCFKRSFVMFEGYEPKELSNAALLLKKGEYTKTPLFLKDGIYILFVSDRKKIGYKESVSSKGSNIPFSRISAQIKDKTKEMFIHEQIEKNKAVFNETAVNSTDPKDVIFKTLSLVFTQGDFKKVFDLYIKSQSADMKVQLKKNEERIAFCRNLFEINLFCEEAKRVKYLDDDYLHRIQNMKDSLVAREFIRQMTEEGVSVAENDITSELAKINSLKKGEKNIRNMTSSREEIKQIIFDKAVSLKQEEWRATTAKKYNIVIHDGMLKGK